MSTPPCRHCGKHPAHRPRGLCWGCYDNREIRNRYPSAGAKPGAGVGVRRNAGLPKRPTRAKPGTREKVEVMEVRAAEGHQLHHPHDAPADNEHFIALVRLVLMACGD